MKPKIWKTKYGTLTVTQQHVIDSNGGITMWTHGEFLVRAGGILHDILRKTYGDKIYQEAVDLVMSLEAERILRQCPDGAKENAADS